MLFTSGIVTVIAGLMFFGLLPVPSWLGIHWTMPSHGGFFVAGGILMIAAALLWFGLGNSRPEGTLLVLALAAAFLGYPLGGLIAPSFDATFSPKDQSLLLRAYVEKGYQAASYHVPDGLYSYYSGSGVTELKKLEEALPLAGQSKFLLALPAADADSWESRPDCLTEVHAQFLGPSRYTLLACPPIADLPPAAVPYAPAPDFPGEIRKFLGLPSGSAQNMPQSLPEAPRSSKAPATEQEPAVPAADSPAPSMESTEPRGNGTKKSDAAPDDAAPAADSPASSMESTEPRGNGTKKNDAAPDDAAPVAGPAAKPAIESARSAPETEAEADSAAVHRDGEGTPATEKESAPEVEGTEKSTAAPVSPDVSIHPAPSAR
jgi:hypothetical protein